jgi:hypothetical protein
VIEKLRGLRLSLGSCGCTKGPGPRYDPKFLEQERRSLGEDAFKREYFGVPLGAQASPFTWELYERATQVHVPLVPPGPAFGPPVQERGVPIANPFKSIG